MNYIKIYNQLIEHAKLNPPTDYNEVHHIIPHAEGGSDDTSNKVKLTARQHYVAHLLLAKIYDDYAMHAALIYMQCKSKSQQRNFKFNSRLYEKMREEFAKKASDWRKKHPLSGKNNPMYGRHHTEESKKKMSNNKKGQRAWLGKHHTEESKKKISNSQKGKKLTEEHKNKIKAALARPDVKARLLASLSKTLKGKFWVTNGKTNRFLSKGSAIPDGFHIGRTINSKGPSYGMKGKHHSKEAKIKIREKALRNRANSGMKWWNNGIENVMSVECPEGFVAGRLKYN